MGYLPSLETPAPQPDEMNAVRTEIRSENPDVARATEAAKKLSVHERRLLVGEIEAAKLGAISDAARANLAKLQAAVTPSAFEAAPYMAAPAEVVTGVRESFTSENRGWTAALLGTLGITTLASAMLVRSEKPGWTGWMLRTFGLAAIAGLALNAVGLGRSKIQSDISAANPAPAAPVAPPESEPKPQPPVG